MKYLLVSNYKIDLNFFMNLKGKGFKMSRARFKSLKIT